MPIAYSISADEMIIHEKWTGPVSARDLKEYWSRYLQDPKVLAIRRTLVDLRDADILFTGNELSGLVHSIVLPALEGRNWISALLVGKPVQHGVSRQYQVFAEFYSRDAIFDDAATAEKWLRDQAQNS